MTFASFENIVSLLGTIVGLLYCVFKYIETPKRGYRIIIAFFLANFLSEYYWTVYQLIMPSYPDVSEFVAYFGWNVSYCLLLLAVYFMRHTSAQRYFHPVMILPVVTGIPLFWLYIQYGGILNNTWEVGITTLTLLFCLQDLMHYRSKQVPGRVFPWFSLIVLLYVVSDHVMWTSSCFSWDSELFNPYLYFTVFGAILRVLLVFGTAKYYEPRKKDRMQRNVSELGLQVAVQAIVTIIILGICTAGLFLAVMIRDSFSIRIPTILNEDPIVICLFSISAILIILIFGLLCVMGSRYRRILTEGKNMSAGRRSRINFIFTIAVTLILMVLAVAYNNMVLYRASVVSMYEDGEKAIKASATDLENYLTVAVTTVRVAADSVDLMKQDGRSVQEIEQYIKEQTKRVAQEFDENFTGLYASIDGIYLDGLGWEPPAGYDPAERDWYQSALAANGEVVIVSPYVDAQTGEVVITVGKEIMDSQNAVGAPFRNVVCLDVIVGHIKEVTEREDIAGKGYGMVVNEDGFIVAHREDEKSGQNLDAQYDSSLLEKIINAKEGRITAKIHGEDCTLFVAPVMKQWYSVIVIRDAELLEDTYSQLAVNIVVSIIIFCLITFFYYIAYKNEQAYGKKVEEMNLQVVTALAAAVDAKDKYTNGHSARVAEYSRMIASRSGFSVPDQDEIYMMGLLHDVGKIGIPDEVINKASRLSDEENEIIKKHPVIGSSILESIRENPNLAVAARWHHECYDGSGYPDGIAGEAIPEKVRIIAVADAYDAMTSRRSYRNVMPQSTVMEEIRKGIGTQFDPRYAQVMIELIEEDRDYQMREKESPANESAAGQAERAEKTDQADQTDQAGRTDQTE